MKNILIIQQPVGNRGDESAHRGLMHNLTEKYPNCKITVLFFNRLQKDIDEFVVNHPNISYKLVKHDKPGRVTVPMLRLYAQGKISFATLKLLPYIRKIISYYKQADYIIGAPGGINLGGFKDWIHLAMFMIAKDSKCKVGYFARSIGPFSDNTKEDALFKKRCEELFNYFSVMSLRDDKSIALANTLSIDSIATIDSAFLRNKIECNTPSEFAQELGESKYLVFVPNCLVWHYKYKTLSLEEVTKMWAKLLNKLLDEYQDYKVVMLPQTTGYTEAVPDGYIFFNKIKELSHSPQKVVVLHEKYGSDIQQKIIGEAKFLVGARYHSVVFAINQGVPFLSLTYEHKMSGLLSMIELSDNQIDIEKALVEDNIDTDKLIEKIISKVKAIRPFGENRAKAIASKGFELFFNKVF